MSIILPNLNYSFIYPVPFPESGFSIRPHYRHTHKHFKHQFQYEFIKFVNHEIII